MEKYSLLNVLKPFVIDRALVGGYVGAWLEIRPHYPNGPAFGGMVGTARAVAQFLQDQLRAHSCLLDDSVRPRLFERQTTTAGRPVPMTLGWHIRDTRNGLTYFKEGGGGGFHCLMSLYPSRGVGSVLMTNATGFNVTTAVEALDAEDLT